MEKCTDPNFNKFPTNGRCVPFVSMISIIVKKDSKKHWLHQDNLEYLQQDRNIKKIQIEDILKPVSDKRLRFVLIEGEPGIGKSTLAKELALRWAKKSDQLLSNYTIVIFIPLRLETYHKAKTIEDLFIDVEDISMTKVKSEIKKKNGAGVLWILDGFDELPINLRKNNSVFIQLINGEILYKSTVIVTGRPVASKPLLEFSEDNNSKRISLRGFDSNKTLEYASRYFNNNEVIVSKFKDYYNGNLVIESMMYNPMTCYIVCTIFNDIIMANGTQYLRTMTSLYNYYVRVLLKRHLIYVELVDRDYSLPERLIVQTDFINPALKSIWKNFTLLSKIAYDGVMKQKYVFGNELHNVTKLSMMDTIVSFSMFDKDESSSFIHTTLQEYFAAIYIANNPKLKLNFTYNDHYDNPNLEVVLTFYVGILKMVEKEVDNITMDILERPFEEDRKNKRLFIDNLLCKYLYEHDSLMNFFGFQHSYTWVVHASTKFDFFILGYLVAAHNITYEVTFRSLYQLHAFKGGLQFHSNVHVNGKLKIKLWCSLKWDLKEWDSKIWDLKDFFFIPSHTIAAFKCEGCKLLSACEFISQFRLLQELSITIDSSCSSEKVHPLLELKTLYELTLQFEYNLIQEYDKLLNPLIAPGRPLKILHLTCSESYEYHYIEGNVHIFNDGLYCVRQFPSLIQSQTSLEELKIDDIVVWHKNSNSLVISYQYQIIETSPAVTVKLTSVTSFTYIRINKKLFTAKITIYSEPVMSELSNFVSAFENCRKLLKSSNIDNNVCHKIQLSPFMYATVSLEELISSRYPYTCPCDTCNIKGFLLLYISPLFCLRVGVVELLRVVNEYVAMLMLLYLFIRLTCLTVYHIMHSNIMHPIFIIELIISEFKRIAEMQIYFSLFSLPLVLLVYYWPIKLFYFNFSLILISSFFLFYFRFASVFNCLTLIFVLIVASTPFFCLPDVTFLKNCLS